jgi:hypothetical protein
VTHIYGTLRIFVVSFFSDKVSFFSVGLFRLYICSFLAVNGCVCFGFVCSVLLITFFRFIYMLLERVCVCVIHSGHEQWCSGCLSARMPCQMVAKHIRCWSLGEQSWLTGIIYDFLHFGTRLHAKYEGRP